MMKCDMCGMMMKDENEHRMHVDMMRSMMTHMMRCMEMGMDNMGSMHGGGQQQGMGAQQSGGQPMGGMTQGQSSTGMGNRRT